MTGRFLCGVLGLLVACSSGGPLPDRTVGDDFQRMKFTITGGTETVVLAKAFPEAGQVVLCGAWGMLGADPRSAAAVERFLISGGMYIGDTEIRRNLLFMREVSEKTSRAEAMAACIDTGVPWHDSFDQKLLRLDLKRWSL